MSCWRVQGQYRLSAAAILVAFVGACSGGNARQKAPEFQTTEQLEKAATRPQSANLPPELKGRVATVTLSDKRVLTVRYHPDGTARMTGPNALDLSGDWFVAFEKLCFEWQGLPRECWPYKTAVKPGEPVTSTSDLGQTIESTLQ